MAHSETTVPLRRWSDTAFTLADPAADMRARQVVDRDGTDLGEVADLLMDECDKQVRFLDVAAGGFSGIGQTTCLLPVEAITRIRDETMYVNQIRQHLAGALTSAPALIHEDVGEGSYYGAVYRHYGYTSSWGPGFVYPPYPYSP
jgi:sporulation protein YlmC with PRC-barrel domain